ncbi:AAA family ATPase [Tolypothrix sp. PCC 7910]|uniref:ATP-binding sensor histidine kinase n=1 Tax=Tolypothrix sp. PCC 7910 TaxID=2099387 RepID=UPI001427798F|nr:ATP-binding sensor histidine kinase [Tolypothrix sp. PCC 7910]QIR41600.1 AAA family ATPase [Tolypothrix sp. PCC 7910]
MYILSDKILSLRGYRITEQVYNGSKTIVYRGIREQDEKTVIIKLMRNEFPTFQEIAQFRNQYTITKNLKVPGIVKPLSQETYGNSYALIMEDFGGISLKDWIQHYKSAGKYCLSLQEFFPIAIAITSTLEELHRSRIIHKDIKTANILINPTTLEVKIIDFSIATLLSREIQSLRNPNVLEGTLAYISPEQTGRMNRGIDYRTDFYSLGVTFFELLTGQLPFISTDAMDLVYCHIAKQPPKASRTNNKIPPILSDIIDKLISKNAEDRYQSAYGLRYDLEFCFKQWQKTASITSFELALKDISDRFVIPEKLYGRQAEIATLLAAFERVTRGTTEMILVAGFSGIGKTAVVNEVHKPILRQQSYFIKGKFDQFQRDIPLSGLVQAFRDLIGQLLLETDVQVQKWRNKILAVLGEQAQVIIDVIPELEYILGQQPNVAELSGSAVQNRFNLLFQRFVQVFSTKEHPLVMFLDDLQWADTASLKFIQLLMSQNKVDNNNSALLSVESRENIWNPIFEGEAWDVQETQASNSDRTAGGLLIIGAYRDNEVAQAHPLSLTIKEMKNLGVTINQITLSPLNQAHLNRLIADTLHCREEKALPLSQMVFSKTKGNPFFTNQFLKSLHQDGIINFNFGTSSWQYDLETLQTLVLTDDVVEFMALQIGKLPIFTQEVLQLAACIGNEFDLKTLAIVNDKSVVETASKLWSALHEGLILPQTDLYKLFQEGHTSTDSSISPTLQQSSASNFQTPRYKFIHDRVQQAAYFLIPEDQRKHIHLKIGLLLWSNIPDEEREEKIFQLVNQLNIAVELITDLHQREELAQMNLIAGTKALSSTAYAAAIKYLKIGIELLPNDSWISKYQLTLKLYETAAEAAYLCGEFEQMEQLVNVVLLQAKTLLEKVKVYDVKIQAYGAQNQPLNSVNTALNFVKLLGVEFPENPGISDVQLAMAEITSNIGERNIEDLIHLPNMTDAKFLAVIRIISSSSSFVYQAAPQYFPLIVIKQIELSLKYGNAPLSSFAYVLYGLILCGMMGDIESGYQFGNLALSLTNKFNVGELKAKVIEIFYATIRHCKKHTKEILNPLLEGYSAALQTGDLEFASYCIYTHSYASYFVGRELNEVALEMASYSNVISQIKQERVLIWHHVYRQSVLNLLQSSEQRCSLIGEAYDEEKMLPIKMQVKDGIGLLYLYFNKIYLCYLFHEFDQAIENSKLAFNYLDCGVGNLVFPLVYFYDSLAKLAAYNNFTQAEQNQILDTIQAHQEKMKFWAYHAPMNYLHKFYLVEAERYRVRGEYLEAIDCYDRAISLAKENQYVNEEALANELAARFYLAWGKEKIAKIYLIDSYYAYSRWGAKAKVDDLVIRYPRLLASILQPDSQSHQANEKVAFAIEQSISHQSFNQTIIGSKISISDSLDLTAIIKVSQALSGEIDLDKLMSILMQVVMENAGASKSSLILSEGDTGELKVATVSVSSISESISISFPASILESSLDVPVTLINYVKRHREIFVVDEVKNVSFLAREPYIIREKPQSLLCLPIIHQGKLVGILYLENNLTTGAFTHDRINVLQLLTTQAAISLENAMLYHNLAQTNHRLEDYNYNLEEKIAERTQEIEDKNQNLQQALQQLQQTQTQLIQSEKMSSLGEVVAGIAHEINNPINFIYGNITHASEYVKHLLELIAIYQQEVNIALPRVEYKKAEIDLDFLAEDLPKILESMKVGSSRISNIVLGLRNFSRLDEAEMKPVDIHDGITNTLMLLQHRFQEESEIPKIEVIEEYAKLPLVSCYAGQLNQVFMNIISNAIDALENSKFSHQNFLEKNAEILTRPQIRIRTQLSNSSNVQICIADNGCGMTEAVVQKIFEPFFTTKPVGSGTGLGLSISYQVVVEKHKGKLICNSVLGEGTEFVIEIPI